MQQTVKERINDFIKFKKISARAFEARCSLSNGYLRQLRSSPTADKIETILSAFPELRREWLMTGEGEMLKAAVSQSSRGDNSPNLNGDNITYGDTLLLGKALNEIAEQRKLTEVAQSCLATAQAQITDLITQNKAQFAQFMSMLEAMHKTKTD